MTRRQSEMFSRPPAPPRRVMMHVIDAGQGMAEFECGKCGHNAGWLIVESITEAKRGEPCPICNDPNK